MHDLEGVDAPREWLSIFLLMPALIRAPNVQQVAELLYAVRDAALEEPMRFEVWVVPFDIHVGGDQSNIAPSFGGGDFGANHSQPCIGQKERAESIPVAGLAGRPGDYVIKRSQEVIHRVHVARYLGR